MHTVLVLLATLAPVLHNTPLPDDVFCLATTVHNEARGEPLAGQLRVMDVVLNRVEHDYWPDSVCEVVSQPHQFAFFTPAQSLDERITEIAIMRLGGLLDSQDLDATFFYNPEKVSPDWATEMEPTKWVGQHLFLALE